MNSRAINLKGKRFKRLKVIRRNGTYKSGHSSMALWLCKCRCGNKVTVRGNALRAGSTTSCGCYNKEVTTKRLTAFNFKHGKTHTAAYKAYSSAKKRCTNPKDAGWKYYGGRGIKFLFTSFEQFFKELGPRPSSKHSLDRYNNDGHYVLGNCRWATRKEQMKNRRVYATRKRLCCANCGSTQLKRLDEAA